MNYDEIMRNLEYTITEHKDKFVGTFETNIYDMARDCKRFIEWQQKEIEALKPQPDPDTGLKGCWHCRNIEAHHIEYVIAVKAKGGTPMNMPVDCPYHHCPACGRKLEEKK